MKRSATETAARSARRLALLLFLAPAAALAAGDGGPRLTFLDSYDVAAGTRLDGTCVGGLSAIAYAGGERYFVLSDSGREARFYRLKLALATGAGGAAEIAEVAFERAVRLKTREGLPYPEGRVDPEGLALLDDRAAFLSSEGAAPLGVPPFVDLVALDDGAWLATAPLPVAYRPLATDGVQVAGVRRNLGLEALALSPDRRVLYAATESALAQDAAPGKPLYARLLRFAVGRTTSLAGEYLYPLVEPEGEVIVHGVVELLALDDGGRLLALERTYGPAIGLAVTLYAVDLEQRAAPGERAHLAAGVRSLPLLVKRPLLDFATLPVAVENYEGMTLGPPLPGGGQSLLIVGDNDDVDCTAGASRPSRFLLFRLE